MSPSAPKRYPSTIAFSVVAAFAVLLAVAIHWNFFLTPPTIGVWDTLDVRQLIAFAASVGMQAVLQLFAFLVLGAAVTSVGLGRAVAERADTDDGASTRTAGLRNWLVVAGACLILAAGVLGVGRGRIPSLLELLLPCCSALIGSWFLWWWRGGWKSRIGLGLQFAAMIMLGAMAAGWLVHFGLADEPLPLPAPRVTSAEKRAVFKKIQRSSQGDEGHRHLELDEHDVNVLLNMGAALSKQGARIAAHVGQKNNGVIRATVPLPGEPGRRKYLNGQVSLYGAIRDGQLDFRLTDVRIGRIKIPQSLLSIASFLIRDFARRDRHVHQLVARTNRLDVRNGLVVIDGNWRGLRKEITGRLMAEMGARPEAAQETRIYMRRLLMSVPASPQGDSAFLHFTRTAFALAQQRTRDGHDAVAENRAAILALGILLGHPKVERLVGDVITGDLHELAKQSMPTVTLRSRRDWTRHFWVSASLTVLANLDVSDAVGLLKEELDAGEGGSGFSFPDLAADMAGTRLANLATRDAASARRVQSQLATIQSVGDLLPAVSDLPEGLPDAEFRRRFGGVGGTEYQKVVDEIKRRLSTCRLLQDELH